MMKATCLLLIISLTISNSSSIPSVISRILDQAKSSGSGSPIILVIKNRAAQESSSSVELPTFKQSSEEAERNGVSLMSMLSQFQNSRPSQPLHYKPRYQPAKQKLPRVYKSLLSLRNSLRCGARNECKAECSELPKKRKNKCAKKCEKKYECEEEVSDCSDECSNKHTSTRAPRPYKSAEKCSDEC